MCRCPSEHLCVVPVPQVYRRHKVTDEYVLVCTRCGGLWDHRHTDAIIEMVKAGEPLPPAPAPPPSSSAKPPDLQDLIGRFGGYANIPPEAWVEHDRAMAAWKQARGIGTGLPGKKQP
jgi:hypothetical protein